MRLIDADYLLNFIKLNEIVVAPGEQTVRDIVTIIKTAPTIEVPPNDPLTLEELREMDGEPVWVERPGYGKNWALVNVWAKSTNIIYLTCNNGMVLHPQPELDSGAKIYRRKPEAPANAE